jgi:hypothetical protein
MLILVGLVAPEELPSETFLQPVEVVVSVLLLPRVRMTTTAVSLIAKLGTVIVREAAVEVTEVEVAEIRLAERP